jgi:hypothetical protein
LEKTQKTLHFISLNRKKEVQVQPPEGGTHTHGRPHQKVRRCQTLQTVTTTKGLALSSLQPRMARRLDSEHQGHVTAIAKRHQRKPQLPGYPPTLMCLEESAGGWQDPTRTSEAIILEAPSPVYTAPGTPMPYAAAHSHFVQNASPNRHLIGD